MGKKIQRRNALFVIFVGAALATLICSECFLINTTASVPRGIWLKLDIFPQKGDFVQVPIDAFSSTEWVPPDYFRKNMWGKRKPFLKIVAGSQGDNVELGDNGLILINGVPFPDSKPFSLDRAGRPLRAFHLPITLASDEIWLLSQSPFGFDSRYLGTANIFKCYKAMLFLAKLTLLLKTTMFLSVVRAYLFLMIFLRFISPLLSLGTCWNLRNSLRFGLAMTMSKLAALLQGCAGKHLLRAYT